MRLHTRERRYAQQRAPRSPPQPQAALSRLHPTQQATCGGSPTERSMHGSVPPRATSAAARAWAVGKAPTRLAAATARPDTRGRCARSARGATTSTTPTPWSAHSPRPVYCLPLVLAGMTAIGSLLGYSLLGYSLLGLRRLRRQHLLAQAAAAVLAAAAGVRDRARGDQASRASTRTQLHTCSRNCTHTHEQGQAS